MRGLLWIKWIGTHRDYDARRRGKGQVGPMLVLPADETRPFGRDLAIDRNDPVVARRQDAIEEEPPGDGVLAISVGRKIADDITKGGDDEIDLAP